MQRFRTSPRPNVEVIEKLETALEAARRGHIRAIVITTVNPLHEVENALAGDINGTIRHALIGGLSSAAHKLLADEVS